jgi:hypothetical protein
MLRCQLHAAITPCLLLLPLLLLPLLPLLLLLLLSGCSIIPCGAASALLGRHCCSTCSKARTSNSRLCQVLACDLRLPQGPSPGITE